MPLRPQPNSHRAVLASALVASLTTMGLPAYAQTPTPGAQPAPTPTAPAPQAPSAESQTAPATASPDGTAAAAPPAATPEPAPSAAPAPTVEDPAATDVPPPEADTELDGEATANEDSQLEGDLVEGESKAQGQRMKPLQAAGWWTMFGGVALATAGGVFVGMMANEEDDAFRLALPIDGSTGRHRRFSEVEAEYKEIRERGEKFEKTAHALLIAGGAAAIVSTILLATHAGREKKRASRVSVRSTGLELKF